MLKSVFLSLFLAQAELTGEIVDPSGAAIAQASIVLTSVETNATFRTVSGGDGRYLFPGVKPGRYNLAVEASGFQRTLRQGVTLITGERIRVDFALAIGSAQESIRITADAPLLRTESAGLGQVVEHRKVVELPLNGRTFISLVALAPGVAMPPGSAFPRINGGRPRTNEYLFDGVTVLQPEPGQVTFMPVVDAVQEFKVETNSPPAEFGRFNGGVIQLTTKSGTNQFHGTVFEFLRNEALNARNLFAPATPSNPGKPLFRRNQFGAVMGGPIIRNKTFFFADYQGSRQSIGRVRISTVPTVLQRQGILSSGTIPRERMDSTALTLLGRYPLPTSDGTANNYRRIGAEMQNQDQWDARIDHRGGASLGFFTRFSRVRDVTDPVTPLPDGSGAITSGALGHSRTIGQSLASSYLHVFGPSVTNEARFGYSRRRLDRHSAISTLPAYVIDGYQQLGPPRNVDSDSRTDVTHLVNTLSQQKGRHFVKAGLDYRWQRLDIIQPGSPAGLFGFSALQTGFSLASVLLGQVDRFSIDIQQRPIRPRAMIQEYFAQDDWKASRRLTIDAGIRYTLNFPSTELDDQGAVFDLASQKLRYLGRDGFPRSSRRLHRLNFGPRLGLAYHAMDKTVFRSGYALIWIEQAGITTPFTNPQFPFIQTVSERSLDNTTPAFVLSDGPSISPIPFTPEAGLGQGVFTVDRDLGSGYAQQWNLSIQREIGANILVEAAYTGSKITNVGIPDTNINQLSTDQLRLGPQLLDRVPNPFLGTIPRSSSLGDPTITRAQLLKPFPRFTTVSFFRNNVGNTNYHAFQAKVEKRFSRGFSMLASFTRSKLIDEASSVFDAAILTGPVSDSPVADSLNRKLERDLSAGDIPNVFALSTTYDFPRGWTIAGIMTLQSGLPLPVIQSTNYNAFAGFGTQRPNRLREANLPPNQRTTTKYFYTEAFVAAPQFTLGNSSRNPVRGPGFRNLDLALIKRTTLKEYFVVELRSEVFNLTNTPPLGNPNVVVGAPGFGSITSAGDGRVIQFAVKLHF